MHREMYWRCAEVEILFCRTFTWKMDGNSEFIRQNRSLIPKRDSEENLVKNGDDYLLYIDQIKEYSEDLLDVKGLMVLQAEIYHGRTTLRYLISLCKWKEGKSRLRKLWGYLTAFSTNVEYMSIEDSMDRKISSWPDPDRWKGFNNNNQQ